MSTTASLVMKLPARPSKGAAADLAQPAAVAARADAALAAEPAAVSLASLEVGDFATIHAVRSTDDEADRDLVMRLIEIGFVPGERVRVIAIGRPGHEPIAVRLAAADSGRRSMNGATFAMRRHEADFIRVVPDLPEPPAAR
jgi:ferrous iron transport protein A